MVAVVAAPMVVAVVAHLVDLEAKEDIELTWIVHLRTHTRNQMRPLVELKVGTMSDKLRRGEI